MTGKTAPIRVDAWDECNVPLHVPNKSIILYVRDNFIPKFILCLCDVENVQHFDNRDENRIVGKVHSWTDAAGRLPSVIVGAYTKY